MNVDFFNYYTNVLVIRYQI